MPIMCGKEVHFGSFWFCEDCAKKQYDISIVFCCSECHLIKKNIHRSHNGLMQLIDKKFMDPLTQLKAAIQKQVQQTKLKFERNNQNSQSLEKIIKSMQNQKNTAMLKLIDDKHYKISSLLLDETIIQWLMEIKFWQGRNRDTIAHFENKIMKNIGQKMRNNEIVRKVIENVIVVESVEEDFKVQWVKNDVGELVQKQIEGLSVQNAYRKKEADICDLVIRLMTSFDEVKLWQTERDCQQLLKYYPDSKVLYLSLIRINELLPDANKQIPYILKDITNKLDPNFQSTDMFHYYMAMSNWEMIDKGQMELIEKQQKKWVDKNVNKFNKKEEKNQEYLWFELKNKKYYRLSNPDAYITSLLKAIAIRQKPAYYTALGIGYIVKRNYQEALNVFKQASSMLNKKNDALDLNKFWAELNINSNQLEFESIMESLETRTLQFITNVSKYFKNSKNYSQLVECCEELIAREPEKWNLKIQFIKSILSYSSTVNEFNQDDHQRLARADRMIEDLKLAEDEQASKLQKRLTRVKAQNEFINHNLGKASEGFEVLTKNTILTSGSDFYNYAATQFSLFIQSQCSEQLFIKQAYTFIKKALQIKPRKIKYKKLMFFTCVYMNLFNEAYRNYNQLKALSPYEIDSHEYDRLIQFVKDNMEIETPGFEIGK